MNREFSAKHMLEAGLPAAIFFPLLFFQILDSRFVRYDSTNLCAQHDQGKNAKQETFEDQENYKYDRSWWRKVTATLPVFIRTREDILSCQN